MPVSDKGIAFVGGFEGFASRAYRCPAGVITIGYGFTMGSKAFESWWRRKSNRPLQMGDTITREDADALLRAVLDQEYGAAVVRKLGQKPQNQHDGATSMSFNCGIGALAWRWAKALAAGAVKESAALLRNTATTANGRRLSGLVRRRAAEARLIETGDYGTLSVKELSPPSVSTASSDVKWFQNALFKLGFPIKVDGINGVNTKAAVRKFQSANGLKVDGIVGPATRAALIRALDAKAQNKSTGTAGTGGAVTGGGVEATQVDPSTADVALQALVWGAGIAVVVFILFLIFRNRGRFSGRRVPT